MQFAVFADFVETLHEGFRVFLEYVRTQRTAEINHESVVVHAAEASSARNGFAADDTGLCFVLIVHGVFEHRLTPPAVISQHLAVRLNEVSHRAEQAKFFTALHIRNRIVLKRFLTKRTTQAHRHSVLCYLCEHLPACDVFLAHGARLDFGFVAKSVFSHRVPPSSYLRFQWT